MNKSYQRLSIEEREKIEFYRNKLNKGIREIGLLIGRDKSTISRELRRYKNACNPYNAYISHEKYLSGLDRNRSKLSNINIKEYVINKLTKDRWSPEQISRRARRERLFKISHQIIYEFIYSAEGRQLGLIKFLRHKSKRMYRSKLSGSNKCKIPNLVKISQRPKEVDKRKNIGHFEADLIILNINRGVSILTLIERKTRFVRLFKLNSKSSSSVISKIQDGLSDLPFSAQTITFDRGSEFAHHYKLGISSYFCNPGSPWQKGSVENMNGRVRWLLPKNAGHKPITQSMLSTIERQINNMPLKVLGYKTPSELIADI